MCVIDRHDMTLAVKVALNPIQPTNQPTNQQIECDPTQPLPEDVFELRPP